MTAPCGVITLVGGGAGELVGCEVTTGVRGALTPVRAEWLDGERTLRVEATPQIETSQGTSPMRIYQELRLVEGDQELLLIELHSTRAKPLVYRFIKITGEK
jgi:hypothetical protein